jgi:uncharacterized protein
MTSKIAVPKDDIAGFCQRWNVSRLAFFGSVLRDDFGPHSDIDVLVEFEPGHVPGFFRLLEMEDELSVLLGGRKVDLRTPEDLSRYFRADVTSHAVVQYGKG